MIELTDKIHQQLGQENLASRHLRRIRYELDSLSIEEEIANYEQLLEYDHDSDDFDFDIREIERQAMGYVFIGLRLKRIFRTKRYLQRFSSVTEFCQAVLGRTIAYAKRLIKAAEVTLNLVRAGFAQLPLCEAQARPLTKLEAWPNALNSEESPLCQKWEEIIEAANNQPITAEFIRGIVGGDSGEKKKPIRVKRATFDKLLELANSRGFATVDELLEALAEGRELPEEPEVEYPARSQEELPPPPEELQVSWMEKLRDRFLSYIPPNQIRQAKEILNEYIYSAWLEKQAFNSLEGSLCNSS
jgi:hypothetical protein